MLNRYSIVTKFTALSAAVCLLFGLITGSLIHNRLQTLASIALKTHTSAVVDPLEDAVKPPLFAGDTISLQVVIQKAAAKTGVLSARFYDVDNRLLAQSRNPKGSGTDPMSVSRDIVLEESLAGRIVIEIDRDGLMSPYSSPLLLFVLCWLVFSGLVIFGSHRLGRHFQQQVLDLCAQLPEAESPAADELTRLQQAVSPLLRHKDSGSAPSDPDSPRRITLLTLAVSNLSQLASLLNNASYRATVQRIDLIFNEVMNFYQGKRLRGNGEQLLFTLGADELADDYLPISLLAGVALKTLLTDSQLMGSVGLKLKLAIEAGALSQQDSFKLDQDLHHLQTRTLTLLDSSDDAIVLGNGLTAHANNLHSPEITTNDAGDSVLVKLSDNQQHLLEKQLAILRRNLNTTLAKYAVSEQ